MLAIVLSLGHDALWFWYRWEDMTSDEGSGGNVESKVRQFSLIMAFITFIYKLVMTVVYWMASLNFTRLVEEKRELLR